MAYQIYTPENVNCLKTTPGIPMISKIKAELVKEGARYGENNGLTELYIANRIVETWCWERHGRQVLKKHYDEPYVYWKNGWYLYKENGQWFFKMSYHSKTAHQIEVE